MGRAPDLATLAHLHRLVEESDLRAAQELFGSSSGAASSKLDAMLPKTVKDFEEYTQLLAAR